MPRIKPMPKNNNAQKYEHALRNLRTVSTAALALSILSILASMLILFVLGPQMYQVAQGTTTINSIQATTTSNSTLGHTIAGIDQPLNSTALAVLNNAPNSYFETAGEAYLNNSLTNPLFLTTNRTAPFKINNKTTVFYLGSITCVFCGENKWAMVLALSRFGSFSKLFIGYSALGDADVPTIFWNALNYNKSGTAIGNYYSSDKLNLISIEDVNPITGGFRLNTLAQMQSNIAQYSNPVYTAAFGYFLNTSSKNATAFQGTPYTIWGNYQFPGADAAIFGNTTPSSNILPLTYMTHSQVLSQLAGHQSQFALSEYAAADVYVAAICKSINNNASVCALPAIVTMESAFK